MAPHAPVPTAQHDPRMQAIVGNLLRIGVLVAAAVVLAGAATKWLRIVFALVVVALALEMIYNGVAGRL